MTWSEEKSDRLVSGSGVLLLNGREAGCEMIDM